QTNVAVERPTRTDEHVGIDRFSEPDDGGTGQTRAARTARRGLRQGHPIIGPGFSSARIRAGKLPDRSGKTDNALRAGALVETVDVLRHDRHFGEPPAPGGEYLVGAVGPGSRDDLPPPVVPFPDSVRIAGEGLTCGQLLRPEIPPESVGTSK